MDERSRSNNTNKFGLRERTRSHDTTQNLNKKLEEEEAEEVEELEMELHPWRRVRGGPPLQAQLPNGQQTITAFIRK